MRLFAMLIAVAAIDHPGDNVADRSRIDALSILIDRPADIRRLTDFMLDAWPEAAKLDRTLIGFFGFSRGAYTGLVIAGGRLDILGIASLCSEGSLDGMCAEIAAALRLAARRRQPLQLACTGSTGRTDRRNADAHGALPEPLSSAIRRCRLWRPGSISSS